MSAPRTSDNRLAWSVYPAVWGFLFVVAWRTTESHYALRDLAVVAGLYALLAVALVSGARTVAPGGRLSRLGAALLVALILTWHLREQTRVEGTGATLWTARGLAEFLPLALALGIAFAALEALAGRARAVKGSPVARPFIGWLASTVAFFLLLGVAFFGSDTVRWHVLRHNRMIGTVAFHLFGRPVATIEIADWEAHSRGAPIGQPEWVYDLYRGAPDSGADGAELVGGQSGIVADDPTGARQDAIASTQPPDIVFVMLDTLRADALQAFGGDPRWMPALNGLADRSLLFTEVIANSSWTRPSIASFFTGLVPEEHGALSFLFRISPSAITLAELLGSRGYDTAAFVANSVIVDPASGYGRGFDVFEYVSDPPGEYARADTVTDRVTEWLATAGNRAGPAADERPPLFLYVHYLDPHIPYMSTPDEGAEILPTSNDGIWRYYQDELRFLDGELARMFAALDRELPGPRIMLVAADHGEEFGEHDGMGHSQTLYSEVVDIPVVVQVKNGAAPPPSGRIDVPLEGRDFFELLARSGAEGPPEVGAWATQAAREERFSSLSFTKNPGRSKLIHYLVRPYRHRIYDRMIQRGDWRLVWSAFGDTVELYDLASDPGERHNVARSQPERVRSMRAALDATPPYWVRPAPLDLSPARIEELRALGYIR